MISRRQACIEACIAALAIAAVPSTARSSLSEPFTFEAFEAAQKAGRPIIVEIHAAWCPVCRVQRPIVEDLVMSERFKSVVYFEVNFDKQKDVLRRLNAQKQATLLMFKGSVEVGRSVGDTDPASIEALMAKAV
jgi:thiol-disulfide isomerase/thioredoxin